MLKKKERKSKIPREKSAQVMINFTAQTKTTNQVKCKYTLTFGETF